MKTALLLSLRLAGFPGELPAGALRVNMLIDGRKMWMPQLQREPASRISRMHSIAKALTLAATAMACSSGGTGSRGNPELSPFAEDVPIYGRVLENSAACEVDAVCHLRIAFADTSLVALYGTGERSAPECEISREVSDVAFQLSPDDIITVVVSKCGSDGFYVRELERGVASTRRSPEAFGPAGFEQGTF
jgi:hypothetical protein